jgi:hypothetical protein
LIYTFKEDRAFLTEEPVHLNGAEKYEKKAQNKRIAVGKIISHEFWGTRS